MVRANREDVARLAGVSTAVVSYVVNNGPRPVAHETRERVLAAMEELRYRPNASARALKLSRTNILGLVVTDITNPYFSELALRMQEHAYSRGYGLMVANTGQDGEKGTTELRNMLAREVDGIAVYGIFNPETFTLIASSDVKVVSMDWDLTAPNIPSVGIDDYGATREAVQHLRGHGHREVGLIAGTGDMTLRQQSWADVMRAHCSPERLEALKVVGEFSSKGGYLATVELLKRPNPPSAIFVSSDVQAFGALRAIHRAGLKIPKDITIVSFDGTNASAFTSPALTAIQLPLDEIAKHCVEKLVEDNPDASVHITVPHQLVIRESCGC
jgi:LacI family transcriptional regulator